jgi:serine protease Do
MRKVIVAVVTAAVLTGTALAQDVSRRGLDALTLRGFGSQIGVSIREVNEGVAVERVRAGSPADRAGFKDGDIVIEFDGEPVRSARQFTRVVEETRPDRPVKAIVIRDGSRQTLTVTPEVARQQGALLQQLPDIAQNFKRSMPELRRDFDWPAFGTYGPNRRLGVELTPLSEQLAGYFGVKEGVLVSAVDRMSVAAQAGLKSGDVITAINGNAVDSPAEASQAIRNAPAGSTLELRVTRDKKELTLKARISENRPRQLQSDRLPV